MKAVERRKFWLLNAKRTIKEEERGGARRVRVKKWTRKREERNVEGQRAEGGGGEETNKHHISLLLYALNLDLRPFTLHCMCNKVASHFKNCRRETTAGTWGLFVNVTSGRKKEEIKTQKRKKEENLIAVLPHYMQSLQVFMYAVCSHWKSDKMKNEVTGRIRNMKKRIRCVDLFGLFRFIPFL